MRQTFPRCTVILASVLPLAAPAFAQDEAPSNSLIARTLRERSEAMPPPGEENPHALRAASMFAVPPPRPREFVVHDLVQIIVHETSEARSSQSMDLKKNYKLKSEIADWPNFQLPDLLEFQLEPSAMAAGSPKVDIKSKRDFKGDGEYEREDDLTARLTAEVIEVLPNGNLILEARTSIRTDKETAVLKVTGICRPGDVSISNTVLSNQLHDLVIEKAHAGELRRNSEKGIIAKVLDALFAF